MSIRSPPSVCCSSTTTHLNLHHPSSSSHNTETQPSPALQLLPLRTPVCLACCSSCFPATETIAVRVPQCARRSVSHARGANAAMATSLAVRAHCGTVKFLGRRQRRKIRRKAYGGRADDVARISVYHHHQRCERCERAWDNNTKKEKRRNRETDSWRSGRSGNDETSAPHACVGVGARRSDWSCTLTHPRSCAACSAPEPAEASSADDTVRRLQIWRHEGRHRHRQKARHSGRARAVMDIPRGHGSHGGTGGQAAAQHLRNPRIPFSQLRSGRYCPTSTAARAQVRKNQSAEQSDLQN